MFLATLVEMGFDQKQSDLALKKTGNSSVQSAMDWILSHPDWESELPESSHDAGAEATAEQGTEDAEPKPEPKPLTDEEKAEKAAALQDRLNQAREKRLEEEKKERIEKEKTRRKEGKEIGTIKEEYQAKMMRKQAEERKRQKLADAAAKKRVQEQIAADKAARLARSQSEKSTAAIAETSGVVREKREEAAKTRPTATNTRIQLRLPDGKRLVQVFEADETLSALIRYAYMNTGLEESAFRLVSGGMPPQKFTEADREKTLADLSLVPSAVVMVQKMN